MFRLPIAVEVALLNGFLHSARHFLLPPNSTDTCIKWRRWSCLRFCIDVDRWYLSSLSFHTWVLGSTWIFEFRRFKYIVLRSVGLIACGIKLDRWRRSGILTIRLVTYEDDCVVQLIWLKQGKHTDYQYLSVKDTSGRHTCLANSTIYDSHVPSSRILRRLHRVAPYVKGKRIIRKNTRSLTNSWSRRIHIRSLDLV